MKKLSILLIITLIVPATHFAQHNLVGINWEINFPNNSDYITKTSYSGAKLEYRHFLKKNLSIGIALDWATYEEFFPRQTFEKPDGNAAITTDFVAQAYQVPITGTVHYYFSESKLLKPFAGLALGGQYLEQTLYYNVYASDDDNWGFVVRPEIGTIIKISENFGFMAGAHYSYSTNKTELLNKNSFSNFGFDIGVVFFQ